MPPKASRGRSRPRHLDGGRPADPTGDAEACEGCRPTERRAMRRLFAPLVISALMAPAAVFAQTPMLEPPANHYFTSKGSWGQKYADQWALERIGFDASPTSAWRLVK